VSYGNISIAGLALLCPRLSYHGTGCQVDVFGHDDVSDYGER
jgi:hypothetical protein